VSGSCYSCNYSSVPVKDLCPVCKKLFCCVNGEAKGCKKPFHEFNNL
jgi:hypothetical protein